MNLSDMKNLFRETKYVIGPPEFQCDAKNETAFMLQYDGQHFSTMSIKSDFVIVPLFDKSVITAEVLEKFIDDVKMLSCGLAGSSVHWYRPFIEEKEGYLIISDDRF